MLDGEYVISAGTDGWIKWWNLADIDAAEADEIAEVAIQPIKEISIQTENGEFAHILNVVRGNGIWLVNELPHYYAAITHIGYNAFISEAHKNILF